MTARQINQINGTLSLLIKGLKNLQRWEFVIEKEEDLKTCFFIVIGFLSFSLESYILFLVESVFSSFFS